MEHRLTVSAPGSIMVTGEHAVVYGHPAIVAAIEQRITISFAARADRQITLKSHIAEPQVTPLDSITVEGPYRFVLAALELYADRLPKGLDIDITSEIDPTLGLGSSAAVTVAMLAGLARLTVGKTETLHMQALGIVRTQQGRGSGADLAASLYGGMISYQIAEDGPAKTAQLPAPPPMSLCYSGYKTPTGDVLQRVADNYRGKEAEVDALYAQMGATAARTIDAVKIENWADAAELMTTYQSLMAELGVSDHTLNAIIDTANGTRGTLTAKISGSGLGDCVLAIGAVPERFLPVQLSSRGVVFHD
ncbi:MAG: hypothetical protein AAGA08_07020 [Pseudomonadota bacterium]